MRALSAQETDVLASSARATLLRVEIKDSGGTWRDLSSFEGRDLVEGVDLSYQIDQPVATAEVSLQREEYLLSLAPLVVTSKLNLLTGSYSALLVEGAEIVVKTATVPEGYTRADVDAAALWREVFRGNIDDVDCGADPVRLSCRDLGARLQDTYVEQERVVGVGSERTGGLVVGCRVWAPQMAAKVGEYCVPSKASGGAAVGNGFIYICTVAGVAGATEPAWPGTAAATVGDSGITWRNEGLETAGATMEQVAQSLANDWLGVGVVPIVVPVATGKDIYPWVQDRKPLLEAVRELALQIGWDVRYLWATATSDWRLRLYQPDRAKTTADFSFGPGDYTDITRLVSSRSGIRNAIQVVYTDRSGVLPSGEFARRTVLVEDAASIARPGIGRRFMEIAEDSASQVDTATEATAMANACLADLKDGPADHEVLLPYFWAAELGDLYTFTANGVHYTADQKFAVVGIRHSLTRDSDTTTLTTRGKPVAGLTRWHAAGSWGGAGGGAGAPADGVDSGPTITVVPGIGVIDIHIKPPVLGGTAGPPPRGRYEVHVSTSTGFTPSAATLVATGANTRVHVAGLTAGVTQYVKVIPVTERGRRSVETVQVAAAPLAVQTWDLGATVTARTRLQVDADTAAELGTSAVVPLDREVYAVGAGPIVTALPAVEIGEQMSFRARGQIRLVSATGELRAKIAVNGTVVAWGLWRGVVNGELSCEVDAILQALQVDDAVTLLAEKTGSQSVTYDGETTWLEVAAVP